VQKVSIMFSGSVRERGDTYKDDLEEHLLVNLHELLVPLLDLSGLLAGVIVVIGSLEGVVTVVLAPLDDLAQDGFVDLRKCC